MQHEQAAESTHNVQLGDHTPLTLFRSALEVRSWKYGMQVGFLWWSVCVCVCVCACILWWNVPVALAVSGCVTVESLAVVYHIDLLPASSVYFTPSQLKVSF